VRHLVATLSLLAAVAAAAPTASAATVVLPGAAHAQGLEDTLWVTDLRLLNPGQTPAEYTLSFTPYNSWTHYVITSTLLAGELLALDDVIGGAFGSDASGFITISSDAPLVAGQRTSNLTAGGTFGQYIPAVEALPGEVYLTGLAGGDYRTNLGLVNLATSANHVTVDVAAGSSLDLAPGFGTQLGHVEGWEGFVAAGDSGAVTAGAELACYASVVDNRTGDPTYVPGLDPLTEGVVAGLAHTPGTGGTTWRSDLYLYAPEALTVTGVLVFYGEDGSAPAAVLHRELAAGETAVLADVLAQLAPGRTGVGLLWLEASGPLVAAARTYNLAPDGTFGQSLLAVPTGQQVQPGQQGLFLFAARDSTGALGYRSNLALVNPGAVRAEYLVELLDPTGAPGASGTLSVPPRSGVQQNDVVGWLGRQELADGVIRVTGSAPFTGYLSSVDNRTGDASTVTPVAYAPAAANRAPVAADDEASTPYQAPVTIDVLANDSDPDGDPLTVTRITRDPAHGSAVVTVAGESVVYMPEQGFAGTDELGYEVGDGRGGSDDATVTVTVGEYGTGVERIGMVESTDRGATWELRGHALFHAPTLEPVDPSVMLDNGAVVLYFLDLMTIQPSSDTAVIYRTEATDDSGLEFSQPTRAFDLSGILTDPAVVRLPGGAYRMYVQNADSIISATSPDGRSFTRDQGIRTYAGGVPGAQVLPDGRVRLYVSGPAGITSLISDDGLAFSEEPGVRIPGAGAPSPILSADGAYRMSCAVAGDPTPWQDETYFAESPDAFAWTVAQDPVVKGSVPTLVELPDGRLRIYFVDFNYR
jgi:hypothetical protein